MLHQAWNAIPEELSNTGRPGGVHVGCRLILVRTKGKERSLELQGDKRCIFLGAIKSKDLGSPNHFYQLLDLFF